MPFSPGALKFRQGVQKDYIKEALRFYSIGWDGKVKVEGLGGDWQENDPNGPWNPSCLEAETEVVATSEIHSLMSPCRGGGHMMMCKCLITSHRAGVVEKS